MMSPATFLNSEQYKSTCTVVHLSSPTKYLKPHSTDHLSPPSPKFTSQMEAGRIIAEVGWTMFDLPSQGESEIMAQLLGAFPSNGEEGHQELPWSDQASNPCYYNCNPNNSAYSDSNASCLLVPSECEGYYLNDSNEALGISSCIASDDLNLIQEQGATEFPIVIPNCSLNLHGNGESSCEDLDSVGATNKREHSVEEEIDGQTRGRKCSRKAEPKRTKKSKQSGEEDASVAITNGSTTSCCTSDNDSNASQESADAGASPKGKVRAGRGAATDPQSLYARKRRERINERLKILQNLVPNGTKVDISTMLEEAVHYVKFLRLQIKLLSSDEMWMYAPIVYNGMNIGIDLNIER